MMSLTIFTCLKAFGASREIDRIQMNALLSWQKIQPTPRILVFGSKPGVEDFCKTAGFEWFPAMATIDNEPERVDFIFEEAWRLSLNDTMMYCNADIILPPTLRYMIESVKCENWLGIGQRTNLQYDSYLTFEHGWYEKLSRMAMSKGHLHTPNGMDYFIHKRKSLHMRELYLGRYYWDNVMVQEAKRHSIPVIDCTRALLAIHQDHHLTYDGGVDEYSQKNAKHVDGPILTIANADNRLIPAYN